MPSLSKLDQAIFQIILDRGFVEANHFKDLVRKVEPDCGQIIGSIEDRFKVINNATKPLLSVEIKSVALKDLDGNWVYYHGVVNTEDDLVSKDHGSRFSTSELKFFAEIGVKIIEDKYLSSADIHRLPSSKATGTETEGFLVKLEAEGWLKRNESNYWVLGVRTYLELRSFLEEAIINSQSADDDENNAQEGKEEDLRQVTSSLPQVILY